MYQSYFGLKNPPFSIVPDHRVVYMSTSHRDAVAHLLYSLKQSGGFVQLTGEVGTGKTTVSRYLLQHLPENVDVALLLNPRINEKEMLETICDELSIRYPHDASLKLLLSVLNHHLLASHGNGRHTVLIIDEAQNLSREVLEQIRLLTNLETSTDKLLQIILIGQPELVNILARHDLRQLSQRIVGRFKLTPLNLKETREYISYRLHQAGCERPLFTASATKAVHKMSAGIPRIINVLCDTALMGAYSQNLDKVQRKTVVRAAKEILPDVPEKSSQPWLRYAIAGMLLFAMVLGLQSFGGFQAIKNKAANMWQQYAGTGEPQDLVAGQSQESVSIQPATGTDNKADTIKSYDPGETDVEMNESRTPEDKVAAVDTANTPPGEAGKNPGEGKDTSSRFDLVYRLGVPFRNN